MTLYYMSNHFSYLVIYIKKMISNDLNQNYGKSVPYYTEQVFLYGHCFLSVIIL